MTLQEIKERVQGGETLHNGKKQLYYDKHTFRYVVDGVKTISLKYAIELWKNLT